MIRLGRNVSTLSYTLSAFCFLGTLVLGIYTGTDRSSSHFAVQLVARGEVGGVPVVSSFKVYNRCLSTETTVPLDHRAFLSRGFFINMTV